MKFKVGDKVHVKSLKWTEIEYGIAVGMLRDYRRHRTHKIGYINVFRSHVVLDNHYTYHINDLAHGEKVLSDSQTLKYLNYLLLDELQTQKVEGLEYEIKYNPKNIQIGCQTIPKDSALEIADRIYMLYGSKK